MRVVVITPPKPLVTLEEAKRHLRADGDDDDTLIQGYIAAASGHIDGPTGRLSRSIGRQTLEARFDCTAAGPAALKLPYPPHVEIVSVSWLDGNRQAVEGNPADYEMIGDTVYPIVSAPWAGMLARREALSVRYEAGYDVIPQPIKAAVLLMVGDLYANRETAIAGNSAAAVAIPMTTTVEALLSPFRVWF